MYFERKRTGSSRDETYFSALRVVFLFLNASKTKSDALDAWLKKIMFQNYCV
jgi:hypothetical protein